MEFSTPASLYNDKMTNFNKHYDQRGDLIEGSKYKEDPEVYYGADLPTWKKINGVVDVPLKSDANSYKPKFIKKQFKDNNDSYNNRLSARTVSEYTVS